MHGYKKTTRILENLEFNKKKHGKNGTINKIDKNIG